MTLPSEESKKAVFQEEKVQVKSFLENDGWVP